MLCSHSVAGETVVGNVEESDVQLSGTLVLPKHCTFACQPDTAGEYTVRLQCKGVNGCLQGCERVRARV